MNLEIARLVLVGNIEAIDQGIEIVRRLNDESYCKVVAPYAKSNIGQHYRHVLDVFFAVVEADSVIDFDTRRRGAEVEKSTAVALDELQQVKSWMQNKIDNLAQVLPSLVETIVVKTEVTIDKTNSISLPSSRIRELIFTSSHAVHHYALIAVLARLQDIEVGENLGVAPATASFLRQEQHTLRASSS